MLRGKVRLDCVTQHSSSRPMTDPKQRPAAHGSAERCAAGSAASDRPLPASVTQMGFATTSSADCRLFMRPPHLMLAAANVAAATHSKVLWQVKTARPAPAASPSAPRVRRWGQPGGSWLHITWGSRIAYAAAGNFVPAALNFVNACISQ
jgi:hypothetical protein